MRMILLLVVISGCLWPAHSMLTSSVSLYHRFEINITLVRGIWNCIGICIDVPVFMQTKQYMNPFDYSEVAVQGHFMVDHNNTITTVDAFYYQVTPSRHHQASSLPSLPSVLLVIVIYPVTMITPLLSARPAPPSVNTSYGDGSDVNSAVVMVIEMEMEMVHHHIITASQQQQP